MCPFIRNVLLPDGMYHPGENRGYFKETDRTTGRDKKGRDTGYQRRSPQGPFPAEILQRERITPGRRSTVIRPMIMTRWE